MTRTQWDTALDEVTRLDEELASERAASLSATRSEKIFSGEAQDLQRQLSNRTNELEIVQGQLLTSQSDGVRAERERDSLATDVNLISFEKAEAE